MNRFIGAGDRIKRRKAPRNPFASIFPSRRSNERQSDSPNQSEDRDMTEETISLPPWAIIDRNTFTKTAMAPAAPEFKDSKGDDTEDPVADIIKSLDEFIASVTIPPPPPPLLPSPPPLRGSQLVPRLPPNCLPARAVTNSGRNFPQQQDFGRNAGCYDRYRNRLVQSAAQRQQDWTVSRSDSGQSINLLPQQQLSENLSSPSEMDFSKLVIPPPPPLDTPSPKSILKKRESGPFYNDRDNYRLNSAMVATTAAAQRGPKLPPPLPPLLTPPPLVRKLPSLPPLHPSRARLAGRSPMLSSRASSSAGGSLGRAPPPPPPFLGVRPFERHPLRFSDDSVGLSAAGTQGSEDDDVYADSRQTDGIIFDDRRNGERDSSSTAHKKQINRRNNDDDHDDCSTAAVLRRRIVVVPRAETLSRTYNSVGTFSRATPPVPSPPRLNSSANSSPVAKRPVRRVSFDRCPPSTLCPVPPSDMECDDRQKQKVDRNETDYYYYSPRNSCSSFTNSLDVATDRTEGQKPATAQIRPNALRSSSGLGFHGVVVRGDSKAPHPGDKAAVTSAAAAGVGRVARSGSVDSAPSRTGASVFAAIRSKLKSYWSPSAPRRKTNSLPVNNVASDRTSVERERVEGNNSKGRNNDWRRGRDSSRERSNANLDSRLIVNRSRTDGEDESLEFYRELKQTIPKTFRTFNGQRI